MPASMKWAAAIALVLIALAFGGAAFWQHQHPGTPLTSELASAVPALSGMVRPDTKPDSAATPPPAGSRAPATAEIPMARALDREAERGPPVVAVPPAPAAAATGKTQASPPRFDVVRVEPKGDTVVAGKAAPNAKVALLAAGKVIAEGKADATGQFVLLPPPLAPGAYDLTLRQTPAGAADAAKPGAASSVESAQSVAVAVPKNGGQVAVALAEPGRPSQLLSAPVPSAAPAVAPVAAPAVAPAAKTAMPQGLGVRSVELENGNGFHASGNAAPGTPVHLYLNDTHLADVVAGADGAWSVTIRKGLAGGHYTVRADAGPGTSVAARVEVPFDVPAGMADAATAVSPGDGRAPSLASLTPPRGDTEKAQASASADRARSTPTTSMGAATHSDATGSAAAPATAAPGTPTAGAATSGTPTAGAAPASSTQTADAAPGQSTAVIEEVRTRQVLGGDSLWKISRERLGFGRRFTQIYAANATQIHDPALIYPGQVFVLPAK